MDAGGGDAGPDGARALLPPPFEECGEGLFLWGDAPVELWGEVVDPAVFEPFAGVSGELFVGVDASFDAGWDAGAPDAEG